MCVCVCVCVCIPVSHIIAKFVCLSVCLSAIRSDWLAVYIQLLYILLLVHCFMCVKHQCISLKESECKEETEVVCEDGLKCQQLIISFIA